MYCKGLNHELSFVNIYTYIYTSPVFQQTTIKEGKNDLVSWNQTDINELEVILTFYKMQTAASCFSVDFVLFIYNFLLLF